VTASNGAARALLIRLGCMHYPHLKLKAQILEHKDGSEWLFGVDTHDGFSTTNFCRRRTIRTQACGRKCSTPMPP